MFLVGLLCEEVELLSIWTFHLLVVYLLNFVHCTVMLIVATVYAE